jgi:hypothetical protein
MLYIYFLFWEDILRTYLLNCRSQWPRGLRRRSAAARLLRSWVGIPPRAWMFVCCEYCVLSGRGLCDEPITRPEESYRLWCVVVCDLETSRMRRPWPALGRRDTEKKQITTALAFTVYPVTQHHISEERNSQPYRCQNTKFASYLLFTQLTSTNYSQPVSEYQFTFNSTRTSCCSGQLYFASHKLM